MKHLLHLVLTLQRHCQSQCQSRAGHRAQPCCLLPTGASKRIHQTCPFSPQGKECQLLVRLNSVSENDLALLPIREARQLLVSFPVEIYLFKSPHPWLPPSVCLCLPPPFGTSTCCFLIFVLMHSQIECGLLRVGKCLQILSSLPSPKILASSRAPLNRCWP